MCSGKLIESIGPRGVFGVSSVLPMVVFLAAFLVDEQRVIIAEGVENGISSIRPQFDRLVDALTKPVVWKPMLWIFLWQATPNSDSAFFYYLTNSLSFTPEVLGRVKLVTAVR